MRYNFHDSFAREGPRPPSDRSTGLVFAGVAALVGTLFYDRPLILVLCLALSGGLVLVSLRAPAVLRPLNLVWFGFSMALHRVTSPILMLVLYAIAIVPAGLVMQRLVDPLRRRRGSHASTYWLVRDADTGSMKNQF